VSAVLLSPGRQGIYAATVIILAGVSAALHMAKLFPALPVLRESLGISLVEAGFLVSAVQVAGMTLGLAVGLLADGFGLKRCMLAGLGVLVGAGALAGWVHGATQLLALRALEGIGFLLVCTPAPALIRQLVAPSRLGAVLGIWSAYMPFATALALLLGPVLILLTGWQVWWWVLSVLSLVAALFLWWVVPPDGSLKADAVAMPVPVAGEGLEPDVDGSTRAPWSLRLSQTLSNRGPWLVALTFAVYSAQWVAVIGFLPSIYTQSGVAVGAMAWLTALAAAVNMAGNVVSGRLLSHGVRPQILLYTGFCVMGVAAFVAFMSFGAATTAAITTTATAAPAATFAESTPSDGAGLLAMVRYIAVLMFSMVGGVIPGTLFSLAVRLAPGKDTVSTTVGWMQQWSAFGQFVGPPLVAWVASRAGGWQWTWMVTGACAVAGVILAQQLGRQPGLLHHAEPA
jgi:MFS transporter, CP family, cyanate transporter